MATAATLLLFLTCSVGIAALWNRFFRRVPLPIIALFLTIVAVYEGSTLFTSRVDLPGALAFHVDPWKATGRPAVQANTGIVFTQLAPWTSVARERILRGEWPLWNRFAGCGLPLLASQQTAIFHPFTLVSVFLLPIGKAFTLTAALRLFALLFFTFCLFREWVVRTSVAIFGTLAYTFCVFHIVWLLFPLGLATMMLPMAMTGAQELALRPRFRSFLLLTAGLALSVVGGHPESTFWVWVVTAAWLTYLAWRTWWIVLTGAAAFALAAGLTAFVWMPTAALLPHLERYQTMRSWQTNPPSHQLGTEWLMTLLTPNIVGTPQSGTWHSPARSLAPIDDYAEIASGYAGAITLVLAVTSIGGSRRRPFWFFAVLGLLAFATIAELPIWREAIRALPLAGVTLQQRLRIVWNLSVCALAILSLEEFSLARIRVASAMVAGAVIFIWTIRGPQMTDAAFGTLQMILPLIVLAAFVIAARFVPVAMVSIAAVLTLIELNVVTYRYNPSSASADVFPITGAIRAMQRASPEPYRIAALGWSLLPETPSYYGLEDIKSTNPIQDSRASRMIRGYLRTTDYDEVFNDTSEPFLDYLNVRYVYVPPGDRWKDPRFVLRYAGHDGRVFENTGVLPRYFLVPRFRVHPEFGHVLAMTKSIRDFSVEGVATHVPPQVKERAPQLARPGMLGSAGGTVRVMQYEPNRTALEVDSPGWSLLVSSDVDVPGWRAYWNGRREPTVTVNGAFVGCFLPPGKGTFELVYRPDAFIFGLRLTTLSLVLLIVIATMRGVLANRLRAGSR